MNAEVKLQDLQTERLGNGEKATDDIRFTIGFKNPQEDGYDLTSFDILYKPDVRDLKFSCIDGYSNGTISQNAAFK